MAVPADPKRPWKAYAATALSGLSVFVAAWVADTDPFTQKEIVAALVAAVIGSGITGGATYAVRNPAKHDTGWKGTVTTDYIPDPPRNEAGAYEGNPLGLLLWLIAVVVAVVLVVWLLRVLLAAG